MIKGDHLPLCHPDETLSNVLVTLTEKRCGCILVVDEKMHLKGIFTDGDLRRNLQVDSSTILTKKVNEVMTDNYLATTKGIKALEALRLMQQNKKKKITALPVVEQNRLIGLIRMHDLIEVGIA